MKIISKKNLIFIFFISNLLITKAYSEIVFINLNEIMNKSLVGEFINQSIDKEQNTILENFNKKEKKLKEKENKIMGQKNILSKEEYQKQVTQLKKEVTLYNKNRKKILDELNKKKIESSKKVFKKLNPILTNYMKENSISLILRKKDIIVGKSSLDITSNIIKELDKVIQEIEF